MIYFCEILGFGKRPHESMEKQTGCLTRKKIDTGKSERSCCIFIPSQKVVSLLVSLLCIFTGSTQKVPLFDLESSTRYSADFFCVIHGNFVALFHKFGLQGIWLPTQKLEVVLPWIFPCKQLTFQWNKKNEVCRISLDTLEFLYGIAFEPAFLLNKLISLVVDMLLPLVNLML